MAWAKVGASQATGGSGGAPAFTRTPGSIGNLLIVAVGVSAAGATLGISDTAGNTWAPLNVSHSNPTRSTTCASWCALANGTSSTTITTTGGSVFWSGTLDEFSGAHQTSPMDVTTRSADAATGNPTVPSFTPTYDDELIWAFAFDSVTAVGNIDGSAATKAADDGSQDWTEYRALTGRKGVSMTAAFVGSSNYDCLCASFRPPVVPAFTITNKGSRPAPFRPGLAR